MNQCIRILAIDPWEVFAPWAPSGTTAPPGDDAAHGEMVAFNGNGFVKSTRTGSDFDRMSLAICHLTFFDLMFHGILRIFEIFSGEDGLRNHVSSHFWDILRWRCTVIPGIHGTNFSTKCTQHIQHIDLLLFISVYTYVFFLSLGLFIHSIDYSAQTCVCMALFVHHAILSIGALPAAQTVHPICLDPCFSYHVYRTRTWTPPWNVEIMVRFHLSYSIYSLGSRFK